MQQYQYQAIESSTLAPTKEIFLGQDREITSAESEIYPNKLVIFQANFAGFMEMNEDTDKVGDYFANHQDWFCSCAAPMTVEPLGNNAYILAIGHLNSFGYELEPKIAVALQPQTKV